jgi:DNA-binding Lrp family transcriptional regulator
MDCIQNSSGLKTTQVALKINISARSTRERLKKLLELNLIVGIGTGPFDPNKKYMISPT